MRLRSAHRMCRCDWLAALRESGKDGAMLGQAARLALRGPVRAGLVLAVALALAYGAAFAFLSVRKHQTFHSNAYDLGLQQHVVWNTAHGRWFEYTYMVAFNPGLESHLGDHVNLILLPIAGLYLLHDGPETLLVLQALAVASGLVPLYLVARRRGAGAVAALLLAAPYLAHPALQAALLFDFHPIVLAAPLLVWAYLFAIERRDGWLAAAVVLLLATQENAALVVALLGALLAIEGRRVAGTVLLASGVGWFLVCFFAILPAFNPGVGSNAFARYQHLGASWWQVAIAVLTSPGEIASKALDAVGRDYLFGLLAPFGFASLLAPEMLLCGASETALNLLSDFPLQRTIDYQYASVGVAVGALALVVGATRVARLASRHGVRAGMVACAVGVWALAASAVFQAREYGALRAIGREYAGVYDTTEHARLGHALLARIPPGDAVSAQGPIAPHVSRRPRVYVFPVVADADWVVLDARAGIFPMQLLAPAGQSPDRAYRDAVRRLTASGEFAVVVDVDGWKLLRRTAPPDGAAPLAAAPAGDGT